MLQNSNADKYDRGLKILFIVVLTLGLGLRAYQYFMVRSLWDDETHLALNIIKYGFDGLSKPLDYIQVAPVFFLYAVKLFTIAFGNGELAMRAFPFLVSMLTLPLFYYIVLELTKNRVTALIAFAIFCFNISLIYFSSELKQYAVDVAANLLITFLAISSNEFVTKYRRLLLAIAGPLCIMCSNVSVIPLFCVGCYVLITWIQNKKVDFRDILVFALWAAVFALNYYLFLYHHPALKDQQINYAYAFCPVNIFSRDFYQFIGTRFDEIFFKSLFEVSQAYGFTYVFLALFGIGLINVLKPKNFRLFIFSLLPIVLHLALSAMKMYPFWYRLILYLLPGIIIIVALGTSIVASFLAKKIHLYAGVAMVLICMVFFVKRSVASFPLYPLDIKPVINYVNKYPPNTHIYLTTPINPYTYYYKLGLAKDSMFTEMPWAPWWPMTPDEFNAFSEGDTNNYLFVYGSNYHEWGYGKVIDYLEQHKMIVKTFSERGYIVSEIKPANKGSLVAILDAKWFEDKYVWRADNSEVFMPMWSNSKIESKDLILSKGKYKISVVSKGNPAGDIYPHNNVFVNNVKIGDLSSTYYLGIYTFPYEVTATEEHIVIAVDMDNDEKIGDNDRNSFVKQIEVYRE